uniref:Uncharacterized protein n=1 Tax=Oryza nivara TaxID=4536 RepID=A0A0E0HSL9_ORYNI
MFEGNVPISELFASPRILSDDILYSDGGTSPDKLLMFNLRVSSLRMWPKLSGMLPTKLLNEISKRIREERFPNDEGICPERPFSIKLRYFKGEEMVVTCGIEPTMMFFWRQIVVRDKLLNITSGSLPVSLLLISRSTWRDELLPKDSGISPVRLLPPRSTYIRDELPPKDGGMFPNRLLPAKIKVSSFGSVPKPTGMLPCNLLLLRRPRLDGMAPLKLLSDNCNLVRENCLDVLLHDDKALAGSESWDLKQRRACRSFSVSVSRLLANAKPHTSNELRRATTRVVYGNCGGERQTEERELQCLSSSPPPLTTSLWPVLKTAWPSATLNVVSSEHGGRCPTCSTRAAAPSSWTPCAVAGHYRQQHRGADTVDNAAEHTRQQKRQGNCSNKYDAKSRSPSNYETEVMFKTIFVKEIIFITISNMTRWR